MGKRARESFASHSTSVKDVACLVKKVNNLEYIVRVIYKMMKSKETGVSTYEIKVPT